MGRFSESTLRKRQLMMRNEFKGDEKYGIPILEKCEANLDNIGRFIGFDKVKINDDKNVDKSVHFFPMQAEDELKDTVHFFREDYKFERVYNNPEMYVEKLAQYKHVLTPDFSLYEGMHILGQQMSVFKNRWCGKLWQESGISVIPTVGWSTKESYEFCFLGIPAGSVVAIATIGAKDGRSKKMFMEGYGEMIKRINPKQILCYSNPLPEMKEDNIIVVEYGKANGFKPKRGSDK